MKDFDRNSVFVIVVLVVGVFLSGCSIASRGRMAKIERTQVDSIVVGESTKDDIVKLLGKPQQVRFKPNGTEIFVYMHGIEQSIGIPFIISLSRGGGSGQTLNVIFDQFGTVVDYDYTVDERDII